MTHPDTNRHFNLERAQIRSRERNEVIDQALEGDDLNEDLHMMKALNNDVGALLRALDYPVGGRLMVLGLDEIERLEQRILDRRGQLGDLQTRMEVL